MNLRKSAIRLTSCFSWVLESHDDQNRFDGFLHTVQTVETVPIFSDSLITRLKPGANERGVNKRRNAGQLSGSSKPSVVSIPPEHGRPRPQRPRHVGWRAFNSTRAGQSHAPPERGRPRPQRVGNHSGWAFPARSMGVGVPHHTVSQASERKPASRRVWRCCGRSPARRAYRYDFGQRFLSFLYLAHFS